MPADSPFKRGTRWSTTPRNLASYPSNKTWCEEASITFRLRGSPGLDMPLLQSPPSHTEGALPVHPPRLAPTVCPAPTLASVPRLGTYPLLPQTRRDQALLGTLSSLGRGPRLGLGCSSLLLYPCSCNRPIPRYTGHWTPSTPYGSDDRIPNNGNLPSRLLGTRRRRI